MTVETDNGLNKLTKEELLAAAEQFGVEFKRAMSKADLVAALTEDGVDVDLINGLKKIQEDAADDEFGALEPEPVQEDAGAQDEDDENLVLVRMIRANNTYQIRGYTFTRAHPYALVKENDADFLIERDGGFRMASPKEAREYYS